MLSTTERRDTTLERPLKPVGSSIHCPVCGRRSGLMAHHPEADLYRCAACDHCFSDPTSIDNHEPYDEDYYERTHRNWFAHPNLALFKRIMDEVIAHNPRGSVLDVGCGRGNLLRYLHRHHPTLELAGIDLSCADGHREGIRWIRGDFLTADVEQTYDVVVTFATIEHVVDAPGFVARLRRMCKPGGRVIIMTLNDRSLLYTISRALCHVRFRSAFDRLYCKHHLHHFNTTSLRAIVSQQGLRVVKHLMHNTTIKAIDFDARSTLPVPILKLGVMGIFALSALTGQTYLQTVICERA